MSDIKRWLYAAIVTGNRKKDVFATARIFLDYFDSEGPMNVQNNAASLRVDVPVLWVVGISEDEEIKRLGELVRKMLPKNPGNRFVEVPSDHLNTPNNAVEPVITWIREIVH